MSFSIAEIGHQDLWQRARLGAVSIGSDETRLRQMAERLVQDVETAVGSDARYEIEMIDYD